MNVFSILVWISLIVLELFPVFLGIGLYRQFNLDIFFILGISFALQFIPIHIIRNYLND